MASDKTATQTADRLLAEHWSASSYVRELQNEHEAAQNILFILQDQELRKLEPLIKVRLLLAPLFLRKQERDTLKDSLQVLADKLCLDDDDWVRVTAYAVGRYEGHLDLAAVVKASKAVSPVVRTASGQSIMVAVIFVACLLQCTAAPCLTVLCHTHARPAPLKWCSCQQVEATLAKLQGSMSIAASSSYRPLEVGKLLLC